MKPLYPGGPSVQDADVAAVLRVLESAQRPFTKPEIRYNTHLSDRVVRACINILVTERGKPIVTDRVKGGYELVSDREKIRVEIGRLRHHAVEMLKRATALETYVEF